MQTYVQPRQMMSMILKQQHPLFILAVFLFIHAGYSYSDV